MNELFKLRNERINAYLSQQIGRTTPRMEREFAYFSANMQQFLPALPHGDYEPLFNHLQANRMLSDLDLQQAPIMQTCGWDENWANALHHRPGIVCTFHTGSYRFLSLLMAKAGVPTSLLIAGDVLPGEQRSIASRYLPSAGRVGIQADLSFIDANRPSALLHMARALRQGRSLLVYIDGNTGSGPAGENAKNLLHLPFCDGQIRVRKGAAVLAYRLGVPLYPAWCTRWPTPLDPTDNTTLLYKLTDPISAQQGETEGEFASRATSDLYGTLANIASRYPHEWEGWLNIHTHR